MNDALGFLIFIFIIMSLIGRGKKAKGSTNTQPKATPAKAAPKRPEKTAPKPRPAAAKPQAVAAKPQAAQPVRQPIAPTVQVSHHTDEFFQGSMMAESTEGYDPCHEDLPRPAAAADAYDTAPAVSTDASELYRAFVLQEVLKRPSERRRVI